MWVEALGVHVGALTAEYEGSLHWGRHGPATRRESADCAGLRVRMYSELNSPMRQSHGPLCPTPSPYFVTHLVVRWNCLRQEAGLY